MRHSDILSEIHQRLKQSKIPENDQGVILHLVSALIDGMDEADLLSGNLVVRLLETIADRAELLAIIKRQTVESEALKRITFNLTSSLELQTVLGAVVSEAMRLINDSHEAHIYLYQDGKMIFGAAIDENGTKDKQLSVPRKDGLTFKVAAQQKMVIVEDIRSHPLFKNEPKPWSGSMIGIPLVMGGQVVGVMNLVRSKLGNFSQSEIHLLSMLADQAAIAIVNARLHLIVSSQARSDVLTSLPNRRALDERLDQAITQSDHNGLPFSVVMMDLDGFKKINDIYGHDVGDDVLRQIADSMLKSLRSTDFLARYGGDEMTLVLPNTDLSRANHVARKFQDRLQSLVVRLPDGMTGKLGVSGGIALYPKHANTAAGLLRAADEALYRAKKHARGSFVTAVASTGELPRIKLTKPDE